jgi:hypothetical protein
MYKLVFVAIASLSFVANPSLIHAAQAPQSAAAGEAVQEDGLIFNWKNAPWPDVIDWFAEQAGFVVDAAAQYPEGTFSLKSDRPLSPVEAIDEINHKLRLSDPAKVLLRNGNRLFLVDANVELPGALVETVMITDLNNRGKYEPLQAMFDVSGLELDGIKEQVLQRVNSHNEPFFQIYPDTNEMFVRESGENLRFIRDIIDRAKMSKTPSYTTMDLKHISAELFVDRIAKIHGLDENNRSDDLIVLIDSTPGTQRLIIRGTPEKILDIEKLAAISDVEMDAIAGSDDDPLITRRYPVKRDTQETFEVLDRLLFEEGGGARIIQGSETGFITVRGRKRDHGVVGEYLGLLEENSGGFRTVELTNGNATGIAADTQVVLGITSENLAESVKLLPDDDRDFIMVKGTPIQVTEAVQIIEELDRKAAPVTDGLRTIRRAIPMSAGDRDRILESFTDVWPTMGRDNPFEVRPPLSEEKDGGLFRKREKRPSDWLDDQGSVLKQRLFEYAVIASPSFAMGLSQSYLQSPDDPSPGDKINPESYQLPEQIKSVPGAPMRIWGTEFGIIIESEDLDAGDDAVYLVDQLLGEESEEVKPQIYQLKHVEATYMKSKLEAYYGLSDGGGGGGGGLLTDIADNVMGDAAGGMVDSLFGGGGGASAASTLEGDVTIHADSRLNYLWVMGATENDLVLIDAAIRITDVSTSPQNPETAGQFFVIVVKHRDPEEIKTAVESFMEPYFKDPDSGQQGGGNEAANMMKAMRQAMGGGGGGGGGETEDKKPRGYLSVDKKTGQLHFLGPESIFVQVQRYVNSVDVPEVETPRKIVVYNVEDPKGVAAALRDLLGSDKVEVVGGEDKEEGEAGAEGASGNSQNQNSKAAAEAQQKQQQAAAASMMQAIGRARAAQQRGGGGGGRGGQRGGGGGRGRGGR